MGAALARLVDLRKGEGVIAGQIALTLFLIVGAHTMLETARDALFLSRLPPSRLAFVYAALAGLSLIAVRTSERFVSRFGRRNAFIFSLMAAAYGTTVMYLLPESQASVYGLYLWTGLLGTVLVLQFWLLAGTIFTVSQGKRLFGPLAAGGVLGAVAGAAAATIALRFLPLQSLIIAAAGTFLVTALLLSTVGTDDTRHNVEPGRRRGERGEGLALFSKRPYLRLVATFIVAITATVLMTDYLFKFVAATSMPKDELGPFFAQYYAVLNSVSFIVQIGVAAAVIRRLGVVSSLLVMPALVLMGGIGTVLLGGAAVAVLLTKGFDGSLRHSLHRVSTELLWMPVSEDVRRQAKSFVDTVLTRATQASVAGLILLLTTMGMEQIGVFAGLLVGFAAISVVLAIRLRRPYLNLFREALAAPDHLGMALELDIRSVEVVVEALSSLDPARVVAAIDLLEAQDRNRLIPSLILYHDSEQVLLRALQVIAVPGRKDWVPLTRRLLQNYSADVRAAAIRALAKASEAEDLIAERLTDISPSVRAHAAYWLIERDEKIHPQNDERVRHLLEMDDEPGRLARIALIDAIGDGVDERWTEVLLEIARFDDPAVAEHAAVAMQKVQDPRFIPILVERLALRDGRGAVREALTAHGEPAQRALEEAMLDEEQSDRVRLHLPRSISFFANQRAADFLCDQLSRERNRRVAYKTLRALERMVDGTTVTVDPEKMDAVLNRDLVRYFEVLDTQNILRSRQGELEGRAAQSGLLLSSLLADKLDQAMERAFVVLKILHRHEDMRSVYFALMADDKRRRAQAAEFLDGLTRDQSGKTAAVNRELLRVLADDLPPVDRVVRAQTFLPDAVIGRSYEDALTDLMEEHQKSFASIATYHAINLGWPTLKRAIRRVTHARPSLVSVEMETPTVTAETEVEERSAH